MSGLTYFSLYWNQHIAIVIHSAIADYENAGSTIQMSTLDHLTCSKNIAHANLKQSNKDGLDTSGPASSTAVYDELATNK